MNEFSIQSRRGFMNMAGAGLLSVGAISITAGGHASATSLSSTFYNVNDYIRGTDQASIQAAIDAAFANGGGVVYLPARTYNVQTIRLKKNVTLMGEGMGTLLQHGGNNAPVIITHNKHAYPVAVCSLRIKGSGGGNGSRGIYLGSQSTGDGFTKPDGQHIISHVFIEGMKGEGLYIKQDCRASLVEGCWIKDCRRGMYIAGSDTTVSNCVSRSNLLQGIYVAGGNVRFMNCKTFFNRDGGFNLVGTRSTLVACEAQDNWNYGFRVGMNYATMNGCIADSNQYDGFLIDGSGDYLGGLNLTGITAIGRDEVQASKPWVGQSYGIRVRGTILNDCRFTGIARDNRTANYQVESNATLNNCIENVLNGRKANF